MSDLKTKVNEANVDDFIGAVEDEERRRFAHLIIQMMSEATGELPKMWGSSIVGFGTYTYHYASGRSGDWMMAGFSPRKVAMTLYIMDGFGNYDPLLAKLGKFKTGKSCLYIKREADIDLEVLRELIHASIASMRDRYADPDKAKASSEEARAGKGTKKKATKKKKQAHG